MLTASIVWLAMTGFFMTFAERGSRTYYATMLAIPAVVYLIAYVTEL